MPVRVTRSQIQTTSPKIFRISTTKKEDETSHDVVRWNFTDRKTKTLFGSCASDRLPPIMLLYKQWLANVIPSPIIKRYLPGVPTYMHKIVYVAGCNRLVSRPNQQWQWEIFAHCLGREEKTLRTFQVQVTFIARRGVSVLFFYYLFIHWDVVRDDNDCLVIGYGAWRLASLSDKKKV